MCWSAQPPRTSVGPAVGSAISAAVGDPRNATGAPVGRTLGPAVSATVGPTVRATVLNPGHTFRTAIGRALEIVEPVAGAVRWFAHRSSV